MERSSRSLFIIYYVFITYVGMDSKTHTSLFIFYYYHLFSSFSNIFRGAVSNIDRGRAKEFVKTEECKDRTSFCPRCFLFFSFSPPQNLTARANYRILEGTSRFSSSYIHKSNAITRIKNKTTNKSIYTTCPLVIHI